MVDNFRVSPSHYLNQISIIYYFKKKNPTWHRLTRVLLTRWTFRCINHTSNNKEIYVNINLQDIYLNLSHTTHGWGTHQCVGPKLVCVSFLYLVWLWRAQMYILCFHWLLWNRTCGFSLVKFTTNNYFNESIKKMHSLFRSVYGLGRLPAEFCMWWHIRD